MKKEKLETYQKDFLTFVNHFSPLNTTQSKQAAILIEQLENISIEEFAKRFNLGTKEKPKFISITSTPLNGSQGYLDYFKNKTIEINNAFAIPQHLLDKSISSQCIDDGIDTVDMILNLSKIKTESGEVKILKYITKRKSGISFTIIDDPIKKGKL